MFSTKNYTAFLMNVFKTCFVSNWQIEYEKKKKEDGKRARADKQQVLDMLFSAFEKHQYYNIKDLVDITKQPVVRTCSPLIEAFSVVALMFAFRTTSLNVFTTNGNLQVLS